MRDASSADAALLLDAAASLSAARELADVTAAVRETARALTGAQGVTFVLREGDRVHYVDEDAIAPLWRGQRFPANACISGWAMEHRTAVVIEDVHADPRIPQAAYEPTFVKSLLMVPVRPEEPVAAIGAYWARRHRANAREIGLVESLAGLAAVALANVSLVAELRRAVAARDEFLGLASHELRTPLTPLRLQLDSLSARVERGEPQIDLRVPIARMRRNLDRVQGLLDEMLDVARISEGRLRVATQPTDLPRIVRAVAERLDAAAARIEVDAPERLAALADPARTEQMIEHLVANALKFGGRAPVRLAVDRQGGFARVSVADEGIGITPEDRAVIFERFGRAVPARHFGGLGLGLWLVRELAKAQGGSVEVSSEPGRGATFALLLPLAADGA